MTRKVLQTYNGSIRKPLIAVVVLWVGTAVIASDSANSPDAPRVILLRNGRVLRGHPMYVADQCILELPSGGTVRLAMRDVVADCPSLLDAYQQLRLSLNQRSSPESHLELARWCLREGLLEQASDELLHVMRTAPNHPAIDPLLKQIRLQITMGNETPGKPQIQDVGSNAPARPDAPQSPSQHESDNRSQVGIAVGPGDTVQQAASQQPDPSTTIDLHSLTEENVASDSNSGRPDAYRSGSQGPSASRHTRSAPRPASNDELEMLANSLPKPALAMFSSTIQPLLVNRCGGSACHTGNRVQGFHLLQPARGSSFFRRMTLRNLQSTVQYVRWDEPDASPLLTVPQKPHGPLRSALLAGENDDLYRTLREWVRRVTQTAQPAEPEAMVVSAQEEFVPTDLNAGDRPRALSSVRNTTSSSPDVPGPAARERPSTPAAANQLPASPQVPTSTDRPVPGDPFDPTVFNRRFHGRP